MLPVEMDVEDPQQAVTRSGRLGSEGEWNMPQNDPAYSSFDGDEVDQNTSRSQTRFGHCMLHLPSRAHRDNNSSTIMT